jgi:hypothetical protein
MEQFYLKNASLYDTLVEKFRPAVPIKPETTTTSPSIAVGVRIRPLLSDDDAAQFPCAVFPRPTHPGVVDIHDLYNHPRKPVLKVCPTHLLNPSHALIMAHVVIRLSRR